MVQNFNEEGDRLSKVEYHAARAQPRSPPIPIQTNSPRPSKEAFGGGEICAYRHNTPRHFSSPLWLPRFCRI
jgi:hypothetical protein